MFVCVSGVLISMPLVGPPGGRKEDPWSPNNTGTEEDPEVALVFATEDNAKEMYACHSRFVSGYC